ncbi:Rieske 2Fe-2S domain-containing protein [Hydrogenobacter hydrogenophilus]|nr:Rieske 2Fe-2S domain-containing protein [Hydrogenobacter hydrogenophilus]
MNRRDFIKTCGTVAVASFLDASFFSNVLANQEGFLKLYNKALLIKEDGSPITEKDILPHKEYLFFYPFTSTPCFLLNLGEEVKGVEVKLSDGKTYLWKGGVGSKKSIVAYSAICSHQWSYPTKEYAFINYYPPDKPSGTTKKAGVIQCCAHLSVFDPKAGGKVLEGPAELPLASVVLEEDGGKLFAVGILGKDQFDAFFENYKTDLRKQYGSSAKAKELVDKCIVLEVEKYVKETIRC